MIYPKRILWLLGFPIVYLLDCIIVCVAVVFTIFEIFFLYIKNGNIQGYGNCVEWFIKFTIWYENIEPKENEL